MKPTQLDHQTVFITGASSGIGAALAREFASRGSKVVLTGRREARLRELETELRAKGHEAFAVVCDVTRDGDLEKAVQSARERFGPLDIVVANAGFGVVGRVDSLGLEDYRRQFETNVFGVLRTVHATLADLKQSRGAIALIGSVSGFISLAETSAYSMSKSAIHALAESLFFELRDEGVSVVLITPGFIESEIRRVDNQGRLHGEQADTVPALLRMPTHRAAKRIVDAIEKRKRMEVITWFGKTAVFFKRHFPGLLTWIVSLGMSGRPEPGRKDQAT